jgi:hypothetical protein
MSFLRDHRRLKETVRDLVRSNQLVQQTLANQQNENLRTRERLDHEIVDLKKQVEMLNGKYSQLIVVRTNLHRGIYDPRERMQRNGYVHGGDLKTDLDVLRISQVTMPANEWNQMRNRIEKFYRLDVTGQRPKLEESPGEIIDLLNKRADLQNLDFWNADDHPNRHPEWKDGKERLRKLCNSNIIPWGKSPGSGVKFPRPEDQETLKTIEREWKKYAGGSSGH